MEQRGQRRLRLEELLPGLRKVPWQDLGVGLAVVYGSLAKRGQGGDLDLLVEHAGGRGGAEWRLQVVLAVADVLGLDPGEVDVVELHEAPCAIVGDAWRHGIIVYEAERGLARRRLLERYMVCLDYRLAAERLGLVERAAKAALRRWG